MKDAAVSSGWARRVLVVDDYPDAAEVLAEALEIAGHRAVTAQNGETAIRVASQFAPQVALLDLRLPGMNGLELAGKLRDDHGASLVLVAMSGLSGDEDRERAAAAGFHHYLVKPIDLGALEELLRDIR